MKKLKKGTTYKEVVNAGLIQDKKKKYTINDFKKLVQKGFSQNDARFILLCSSVYHDCDISKVFYTTRFSLKCEYERAI